MNSAVTNAQGVIHYELIPEEWTVNKEIYVEILLLQWCSEKETSRKMSKMQLCTCTLVVVVKKKYLANNEMVLEHLPYCHHLTFSCFHT
jgi:hypothetical protein